MFPVSLYVCVVQAHMNVECPTVLSFTEFQS